MIKDIEQDLRDRLVADIPGVPALVRVMRKSGGEAVEVPLKVASYPKRPTQNDIVTLANAGAVLTRYAGSTYGNKRLAGSLFVQDRKLKYELLCVSTCLLDEDAAAGVYDILDLAASRVIGFVPDHACGPVVGERDDFLLEQDGVWQYGVVVAVPSQLSRTVVVHSAASSDHVVDQIRRSLVDLMLPLTAYGYEGRVHPLLYGALPGMCVWVATDDRYDDEMDATERRVTLCVDGYAAGVQPDGELSEILLGVETALYGSLGDDGRYLDGTAITMQFESATREYYSEPFDHGVIRIRFAATYITEDGHGEEAG